MEIYEYSALINYYYQKNYFNHIINLCNDLLKTTSSSTSSTPSSSILSFWLILCNIQLGNKEYINKLENLQNNNDVSLAVASLLISIYRSEKIKDENKINKLKVEVQQYSKTSDFNSLITAGTYFWVTNKITNARQCIDRACSEYPDNPIALTLSGWIDITSSAIGSKQEKKALQTFDYVLSLSNSNDQPTKNIEARLGKALYLERNKQYQLAIDCFNQIIVFYPWFFPALSEKARLLMMMGNWDEAVETANRVLNQDPQDIDSLRLIVLYLLVKESKTSVVANRISDLIEAIDRFEPLHSQLYVEIAKPCARLSGGKRVILERTLALLDRAVKLEPSSSDYMTEAAYQYLLYGDFDNALKLYKDASNLDESNVHALNGIIRVNIMQGNYNDAEQRLEFLNAIEQSIGSTSEVLLLGAMIASRLKNDDDKALKMLNEAVDEHFKSLVNYLPGYDYFVALNPDLLMLIVNEYMKTFGSEPIHLSDPIPRHLERATFVLNELTKVAPGLADAQFALAKCKFLSNETESLDKILAICIKLDPQVPEVYLLQAQKFFAQGMFSQTSTSLEQSLSLKFEVRQTPLYHIIKAKLLDASGQLEDALKIIDNALSIPGIRILDPRKTISIADRLTIFLISISLHNKLGHTTETTKLLTEAKVQFSKSSEGIRVTLLEAEFAIKRQDFDIALGALKAVPSDSIYYSRSRIMMADIYLKHKKNKKLYSSCFYDLLNKNPSVQVQTLLGEALMKIQEPEKAIKAFEEALTLNPEDSNLASKIGRALITTHDYGRAVAYYESAVKSTPSKTPLFHELIDLYLKLGRYNDAGASLISRIREEKLNHYGNELQSLISNVKSYLLLAKVYQKTNASEQLKQSLLDAWNLQKEVLALCKGKDNETFIKQKEAAASTSFNIAEYFNDQRDYEKALQYYQDSLKFNESNDKCLLAITKLHLSSGDTDACQLSAQNLLRVDPANEEASMVLADLAFRKGDLDIASGYFKNLVERRSNNYDVLARLLHLLKRSGTLNEGQKFLKLVTKSSTRAEFDSGFHYCQGLYSWFSSDPREALKQFNLARKDNQWGESALNHMIEIYLNPDNSAMFEEAAADSKGSSSNLENVQAAEKLLKELSNIIGVNSERYAILEAYIQMAKKHTNLVDNAIASLGKVLHGNQDNVSALLAQAYGYTLLNEQQKARSNLKIISKIPYRSENANDFEKSWLLLSGIYIEMNKPDLATELLKKCLTNNKSCAKAWEYLGSIQEKAGLFKEAGDNFENAWKLQSQASPSVGYKLGVNYIRSKRYVEAIDVCHKVLAQFPDYPQIRNEILLKARDCLRP